jgi:uncharacterized protein
MFEDKIREAVNFIKEFLTGAGISVEKIILFGSHAKGAFTRDSDIDIAIVSRDFDGKDTFQRADMLKGLDWALVERFMLPFDVVVISSQEWNASGSFLAEIVRQGQEA